MSVPAMSPVPGTGLTFPPPPHLTDGKMRPGGSHNSFPQRPSPESNPFPSQGCDPRLMGWGRAEISWSRGGTWGPSGPSWGQSAELPWVTWVRGACMGKGTGKRWGRERRWVEGEKMGRGLGRGRRAEPGAWERDPSRPGSVPHPPREGPGDPFEAAVLGTRRAGPRPGGLHGCGAITQAQVWAQSGRGGGPAGKARAAALARAAPRGARACSAPRAAPARPPLRVWGRPGPAGAPRTPESQARGWGGGGREAAAAPSLQLAAGPWVGCGAPLARCAPGGPSGDWSTDWPSALGRGSGRAVDRMGHPRVHNNKK